MMMELGTLCMEGLYLFEEIGCLIPVVLAKLLVFLLEFGKFLHKLLYLFLILLYYPLSSGFLLRYDSLLFLILLL